MRPIHLLILAAALLPLIATGCTANPSTLNRFEFTRLCMGVQCRVVLYAHARDAAESAAAAAYERIGQLDDEMSDYRPRSELMQLCAAFDHPHAPVSISDDLFAILTLAQRVSQVSDGAFDITIGPAVALWRKSRRASPPMFPSEADLTAALSLVNYHNLILDPTNHTAQLLKSGMRLDLGGIAKGYAAEEALAVLNLHNCPRALVALAGDIAAGDPPPDRAGWAIDVPHATPFTLANSVVSTSGSTEQFVEINGKRYSHIIDPRTGLGLTSSCAVTTTTPLGTPGLADALATGVCVLESHTPTLPTPDTPPTANPAARFVSNFPGATCTVHNH